MMEKVGAKSQSTEWFKRPTNEGMIGGGCSNKLPGGGSSSIGAGSGD